MNPALLIIEGKNITGKVQIANEFAKTYQSVYESKDKEAHIFKEKNKHNERLESVIQEKKNIHKIFQSIDFEVTKFKQQEHKITMEELEQGLKKTFHEVFLARNSTCLPFLKKHLCRILMMNTHSPSHVLR